MALGKRRVFWNRREFDQQVTLRYKMRDRTPKVRKEKPYMWKIMSEEFGFVFGFRPDRSRHSIINFDSRYRTYCGWDHDRHRFIVDNPKRKTLMMRGTWKYEMWYG